MQPKCPSACSSLSTIERDTPQFAYPVPSRCFLRARRLQPWRFGEPVFSASFSSSSFWMKEGLFPRFSDGETALVLFRWTFLEGDIHAFFLFPPRLIFSKMWDARSLRSVRGVLSSVAAAWLKGDPCSFFILFSLRKKRSLHAKGGLSRQGESVYFSVILYFYFITTLNRVKNIICALLVAYRLYRLIHIGGAGLWRHQNRTEHKIRCSVTGMNWLDYRTSTDIDY